MINSTTKQPYLTVRELKEILARHDDDLIVQVQCHKYTTDGDPKTSDSIEDNE